MKTIILALILGSSSIAVGNDQELWLEAHNTERALYGVEPLVWSPQLKMAATRWANKLAKECGPLQHSPERKDTGENIAGSAGQEYSVSLPAQWWIAEKKWYDYKTNTCDPRSSDGRPLEHKSCLHWRQIVSARSQTIGCAKRSCLYTETKKDLLGEKRALRTYTKTYYVCQYAPHGNVNVDTPRPY